jgi:hypothetical protein
VKNINMGCIVKALALVAIVLLGIFIYITCTGNNIGGCQRIDKTLPDVATAPFAVTTRTHSYYARLAVTNTDGSVTITGWYEQIDGKWTLRDKSETIPPLFKPKVSRR